MRYGLTRRVVSQWVPIGVLALFGGLLAVNVAPASAAPSPLVGTFTITAGSCSGGAVSGTYLRMVLSGGTNASGPYFSNSDSSCSDNSFTPLAPGSAGGLISGSYQPQPSPAFSSSGDALANQITAPVAFEGVKFATATNPVDPQTGLHAVAPSITANGTALSGNLGSFGVSWNNQEFNQGSPKPDGNSPGNTTPVVGTYNPSTGAYTLQWSSQVVGGPFNGFSAFWNLTGRFIPSSSSAASTGSGAGGQSSAPGAADSHSSPPNGSNGATSSKGGTTTNPGETTEPGTSKAAASAGKGGSASAGKGGSASSGHSGLTDGSTAVLSSRTITSGQGGWQSPTWLVALVVLLGVLGLLGLLWSERTLRRHRTLGVTEEGA
jgi:hypothetical protein